LAPAVGRLSGYRLRPVIGVTRRVGTRARSAQQAAVGRNAGTWDGQRAGTSGRGCVSARVADLVLSVGARPGIDRLTVACYVSEQGRVARGLAAQEQLAADEANTPSQLSELKSSRSRWWPWKWR